MCPLGVLRCAAGSPGRAPGRAGKESSTHSLKTVGPALKSLLPWGRRRNTRPRVQQTLEQPLQDWKTLGSHSTCLGLSFLMGKLERVRLTWHGHSRPQRTWWKVPTALQRETPLPHHPSTSHPSQGVSRPNGPSWALESDTPGS